MFCVRCWDVSVSFNFATSVNIVCAHAGCVVAQQDVRILGVQNIRTASGVSVVALHDLMSRLHGSKVTAGECSRALLGNNVDSMIS